MTYCFLSYAWIFKSTLCWLGVKQEKVPLFATKQSSYVFFYCSPVSKYWGNIYIYNFFSPTALARQRSQMMSVWAETLWGRRRQQLKKARMMQSLSILYMKCKMDIRVETWQSAPALMWTGIDNDQWLGQWDASLQAGKLIKWH